MTEIGFFIVGATKSGTTSLASWLRQHPQVFIPAEKELHYFTLRWDRGPEWFEQFFRDATEGQIAGEATPTYVTDEVALQRMRDVAPDAKLILMAREPVDRSYSHYKHWHRMGEPRTYAQACAEELAIGRPPAEPMWDPEHPERFRYLAPGRYVVQLETMASLFPREQIHVVFTEDLEGDPAGTFASVCAFLGVDETFTPDNLGSHENVAVVLRPLWLYWLMLRTHFGSWAPKRLGAWVFRRMAKPDDLTEAMPLTLRAALRRHFAPDNAALAEWLGRDVPASWSLPGDDEAAPEPREAVRHGA